MNGRVSPWPITLALLTSAFLNTESSTANEILDMSGVTGGLVVHVGCGDGQLTAELAAGDGFLVQGLDVDAANVNRTRQRVKSLGIHGKVTADVFDGKKLPYTDNLVNLLVVSRDYDLPEGEMLRVLAPQGVACFEKDNRWTKRVKQRPKDIDQWTHYLRGPDNNAVAHDAVVGPPRHMQWLAAPEWTRSHHKLCSISSVVTAEGRLFYVLDEATAANFNVPGKWSIIARDAFSGVTLWKKPMQSWAWHQLRFRSGPPQVTRLLVVTGDRLYAPLGLGSPISVIDAATGKTLDTFEITANAEEIILADNVLLVLTGAPIAEQAFKHPSVRGQDELPNQKSIVAVDAKTGDTLWKWSDKNANPMPETLGSDGKKVYIQIDQGVACLDLKSGENLWTHGPQGKPVTRKIGSFGVYTLVVSDGVVLCKLSGNLAALDAENGKKLWECAAGGGFHAPLDVFVINGLVWQGLHVSDSVAPPPVQDFNEGRDLHTGQIIRTEAVEVDLQTAGHHHRCYREKATDRYIITGKRGIELMDLDGRNHSRNNWIRGACQYGILPANGLMYAPSHACGCYMESKLRGFWALAADRPSVSEAKHLPPNESRLEKGPAFGQPIDLQSSGADQRDFWPMYRHDPLRSGVAGTLLPSELRQGWKTGIGGKLTQPVIAGGKLVVASINDNSVHALDEKSGRVLWTHVAGGRVDSPPVIHEGMVLFGSADGRVYCLRLADGQLVWRFLAARADVRSVAYDQVESLWPVHGSPLLLDGIVYFSAGRSTWIDGGIDLFGLDPATGKVLCHTCFESKHPEFQEGKDQAKEEHVTRIDQNTTDYKTFLASDLSDSFSMAGGTVSDVLTSDGVNVFLHQVKFNAKLEKQQSMSRHLFSTSSLLDGAESHRSHFVLGTGDFSRVPVAYSWVVNRPGRRMPTIAVPTGVMMIFDDQALWGVRRQGDSSGEYSLFKQENEPFSRDEKSQPDFRVIPASEVNQCVWKIDSPVRTTAMLKSGDNLYLSVSPVEIPLDDPHAAYEARMGGMIWICSESDGGKSAEYQLDSPAVWDGMAAANGKLFVSTADGTVLCFAEPR